MAIYNPPKESNWSTVLAASGATLQAAGGITAATGVGAPVGAALAGAGAIASVAGSIVGGSEKRKSQEYEQTYNMRVRGDTSLQKSAENIRVLTGNK